MLLQHRSGLENYYNNPRFLDWYRERMAEDPSFVPGFDTLIEFVCDRPPLFAPGQGFNYSDIGYLLVGLAIESATGRAYYDLAREFYLDPLALMLTVPANTRRIAGLAQGYANGRNPLLLGPTMLDCEWRTELRPVDRVHGRRLCDQRGRSGPVGIRFVRRAGIGCCSADRDGRCAPRRDELHATTGWARAFSRRQTDLPLAYGHDGYIPGYRSSMRYYPAAGMAVALQVNTEDGFWEEGKQGAAAGHLDFSALRTRLNRIVLEFRRCGSLMRRKQTQTEIDLKFSKA